MAWRTEAAPKELTPRRTDGGWALAVHAAVAAGVTVVTVAAFATLRHYPHGVPYAKPPRRCGWLQAWTWWDGAWYVGIARHGYFFKAGAQSSVAFFPVYPLIVRLVGLAIRNVVIAAVAVSVASGFLASAAFYRWCRLRLPVSSSRLALLALLLYPCSFYLFGAAYADALFLALAVCAFLLLETDHVAASAVVCAIATATRPTGIVLVIGLCARAIERRGNRRERHPQAAAGAQSGTRNLALLIAPVGFVGYSAYLWARFRRPFAFIQAESTWHQAPGPHTWLKLDWFQVMIHHPYLNGNHGHLLASMLVTLMALAMVPTVFRRFGVAYGIYSLLLILVSAASTRNFVGMGRYVIAAFPCYGAAAYLLARRPRLVTPVLTASAVILVIFTALHARGTIIS